MGKNKKLRQRRLAGAPVARQMRCSYCGGQFFSGSAALHRKECAGAMKAYDRASDEERVRLARNVKKRVKGKKKKKNAPTVVAAQRAAPAAEEVQRSASRPMKAPESGGKRREACDHYLDRRHCPVCGPKRRTVYITAGGFQRFHLDRNCEFLVRGQEQVRQRGGVVSPIEAVAPDSHRRRLEGRMPCKGCANPHRDRIPTPPAKTKAVRVRRSLRPGAVIEADPSQVRSHEHPRWKKRK